MTVLSVSRPRTGAVGSVMARFKVGLHFYQQHTTMAELRP